MSSDATTAPASGEEHTFATDSGLFARNATGLVREVTPRSAYILNSIGGHPVQPLAYGLFFAFALFPGGSFLLAGLLAIPLALAFSYAFGLMTAMIPRSGGDYTIVSRVLHPVAGLVSSFCQTVANMLSLAFFGSAIVTLGVGPGLIGIGLVAHSDTLIRWGTTVQTSDGWKIAIATAMYLAAIGVHAGGWRFTARAQAVLFTVVTGGLVLCGLIALVMSHGSFVERFNDFAAPLTGDDDTYNSVIRDAQAAGVETHSAFSLGNTFPIVGIFAQFSIFSWFSSFIGGELRQGRSTKTAHMMALGGVTSILGVLLFAAIFIHTFGSDFLVAANAGAGGLPDQIPASPVYFFLLAASTGSTFVAAVLVVTYLLFWVMLSYFVFTQPTRTLFAYAFDGLLPKRVTAVSSRRRSPYVALILTFLLTEAFLLYSLSNDRFYQVIVYATLIQLVSMALVGVAALVVPWRRPELFAAGSTQRRFAGLPMVSWAGIAALAAAGFVWALYFAYDDEYALADKGELAAWVIGPMIAAVLFYAGVRAYRGRQGVDLDRVYGEIPPE